MNVCVPPGTNGTPCGGNVDCDSSNCIESVCCDTACSGTCQSCREAYKGAGPDGICGAAKVGLACGATTCINGVQTGDQCTAASTCTASSTPCAPYLCADANTCAVQCTTDSQCKSGSFCSKTGKCQNKANLGGICKESKECLSGQCIDWVCCDTACGGNVATDCNGCSLAVGASADGTCTLLDNTPCDVNGTCSAGVCLATKDAATDKPVDSPVDSAPDTAPEATLDAPPADAPVEAPVVDAKSDAPKAEGGVSDAKSDTAQDGATEGGAGSAAIPPGASDSGGCGCRTQTSGTETAGWLAMMGAAVLVVRRRRRR
jgi:MYXO-CTERM domain-containing protein